MATWNEEFERCEKCGGGYFEMKTMHLIRKGSATNVPIPMKIQKIWVCSGCGHGQYGTTEDVSE